MAGQQARAGSLPPRTAAWIGWAAMTIAVVMYAGIGLVLARVRPPAATGLPFWLLPALAAVAAFAAVLLQLRRSLGAEPP